MEETCKATIMDGPAMSRALVRIAHEIIERNEGSKYLALVGIIRLFTLLNPLSPQVAGKGDRCRNQEGKARAKIEAYATCRKLSHGVALLHEPEGAPAAFARPTSAMSAVQLFHLLALTPK